MKYNPTDKLTARTLVEYTHNRNGDLNGCVVATGNSAYGWSLGWSLCSPKDVFNKENAYKIAVLRATGGTNKPTPHSIRRVVERMTSRANRYFKVEQVIV